MHKLKRENNYISLGCKMLVTGGMMIAGGRPTSSCYFLDIYFNKENDQVKETREKEIPELPFPTYGSFACSFQDRIIRGGGQNAQYKCVHDVLEFDDALGWRHLPPMNIARSFAGACLVNNTIIVGGGIGSDYQPLDSIETLTITASDTSLRWTRSVSTFPNSMIRVPMLNQLHGKVILLEGKLRSEWKKMPDPKNRVWEGTFESDNGITWKNLESLKSKRFFCFSVIVDQKLYVFGGVPDGLDMVEIFDGTKWESGPKLLLKLSTKNAQAVVDNRKRIIITTNYNGIVIYNTQNGIVEICEKYSLENKRQWYSAITN